MTKIMPSDEPMFGRDIPATHDEAMATIRAAGTVVTLSYEEAIAIYLRLRWLLRDGNEMAGAPIPLDWSPGASRMI